ncbi:nucleotidyltransferase domain-containing protein [Streptacidiphilus cavernicola]|uniref:Nucleotidyltransferase domain-containing protein n=1 Tax=Streptacidiphilus cavernicola TaxID=3342716 RepID=A0ABV6VW78_9ACTN
MFTDGLDQDGYIAREGSLSRVAAEFAPVVEAARRLLAEAFGDGGRLHSAYLYGSVPRGTAVAGVSDLDLLVALRRPPTAADRADADAVEAALDRAFAQVDGVGVLLFDTGTLLSELERHDLGWFVACLCTPLLGPDLGAELPRYRPSPLLARETNGDLGLVLPRWREQLAALGSGSRDEAAETECRLLGRRVGRRLVRTGFTLVMPRWNGWTSDLVRSAEVFGRYYPQWAAPMRLAAEVGRAPTGDLAVLGTLVDGLGGWLAAEYRAVHGEKRPRPQ